ncbi:hypothetical protein BDQ94DRAFT_171745 [Aspergillus welwitschiae]|uniref:Uncharacterized protein n=1 Tax=Aspergillus welwitschiae TaxID=1341132 RepID=A0A3F3PXQ1_9EURO|nr:hypothetical protein BDQ94DRAFT_171745 [Aspergillus welwitschiae]RDH31665.1 hypothetical protein BDQ94DRAFT_171745 [Aspergillus welwitschiae]
MAQERVGDTGGGGAGVSADDDDLGPCRMSPIPGSQRAEWSRVKYRYQIERPRCDPAPETSLFCPQKGYRPPGLAGTPAFSHPGEIHACSPRAQVGCWPAIMIGGWLSLPLDRILPPRDILVIDLMHGAYSLGANSKEK